MGQHATNDSRMVGRCILTVSAASNDKFSISIVAIAYRTSFCLPLFSADLAYLAIRRASGGY